MLYPIINIIIFHVLCIFSNIYAMEAQKALQAVPYAPFALEYEPWRATYLHKSQDPKKTSDSCTFCTLSTAENLAEKYIFYKGKHCYLALNTNPHVGPGYNCLLIPYKHEKHYTQLSIETQKEMDDITHYVCGALSLQADELHTSFHIGTYALASIPNHIHQHLICKTNPRCFSLPEAIEQSVLPTDLTVQYQQLLPLFLHPIVPLYPLLSDNIQDQDCYYCTILQQGNDQRNLIIYKNELVTVLFDHHSPFIGDVIIIPNNHYTSRQHMTAATFTAMKQLAIKIYPLLLTLFNADDINFGMISYGQKSSHKQHIRCQITPRPGIPSISPVTQTAYIPKDIPALLAQLKKEFMQ